MDIDLISLNVINFGVCIVVVKGYLNFVLILKYFIDVDSLSVLFEFLE